MFTHVVMYKLKNPTEQNKNALRDTFLSMKGKISVLKDIAAGVDVVKSARSFDVVLICTFDRQEDLSVYLEHPVHVKVREYVQSVVEKSHSVDY